MIIGYAVVEDAGGSQERIIQPFKGEGSYKRAEDFRDHYYGVDETDELYVDIMGIKEDGTLTTEI